MNVNIKKIYFLVIFCIITTNFLSFQNWKIEQIKDRNRILKLAIEEKRQKNKSNSTRLEKLLSNNLTREYQLPLFKQTVDGYKIGVDIRRDKFLSMRNNHLSRQEELKLIVKRRIQQLLTYIFPITTVRPSL